MVVAALMPLPLHLASGHSSPLRGWQLPRGASLTLALTLGAWSKEGVWREGPSSLPGLATLPPPPVWEAPATSRDCTLPGARHHPTPTHIPRLANSTLPWILAAASKASPALLHHSAPEEPVSACSAEGHPQR